MSSDLPLYEYVHHTVPDGVENEVINYLSKFYWELVQTQQVDYTRFHLESGLPILGVQEITSVNTRISYVTIDMKRNKKMRNYNQVIKLENEYNQIKQDNITFTKTMHPSDQLDKQTTWSLDKKIRYHLIAFVLSLCLLNSDTVSSRTLKTLDGRIKTPVSM